MAIHVGDFRTVRAGHEIEVDVEPAYEQVRLWLRAVASGLELVHLDLAGVRSVGIDRTHGRELLRVDFPADAPAATLWLRMKPRRRPALVVRFHALT